MINRFEYTNNFSLILELTVLHNYFESNKLGTYDLIPTTETNDLIRNYNLLVRKKENKFFILKNNESNLGSPVFKGNVILNFVMKFKDSLFLNITDIPFQYKQKFILTSINAEAGKLHQGYYAGASIIQPYDENGIVAEINFKINEDNEFFGNDDKKTIPLKYFVRFNSRTVMFRYNFYFTKKDNDFQDFFILDENTNISYKDFSKRTLENEMEVFSFILPKEVKMNEKYSNRLYLKKEDEFNKSYSKYLSHPEPSNLKFDSTLNVYFLEVFVKVD
jgi:hypothetical protein